MSKHIGFPAERLILPVTVHKVVVQETEFGPIAHHTLITPEGDVLLWAASTHATWLVEGQTYVVKATIKTHDTDEAGVKRTIVLRVVEHYEPPRVPRVSVGLSRGGPRRR